MQTAPVEPLPLPDTRFDLVASRHPVRPDWAEIHRVLRPGGRYLAQHVGPGFTVERFHDQLRTLDAQLRSGRPFVAYSTRHRIEAHLPAG